MSDELPPRPWSYIKGRSLIHVESSIDAAEAGVPVCSIPKSKEALAAFLVKTVNESEDSRRDRDALWALFNENPNAVWSKLQKSEQQLADATARAVKAEKSVSDITSFHLGRENELLTANERLTKELKLTKEKAEGLAAALEKDAIEHQEQRDLWLSVDDPENAKYHAEWAETNHAALTAYRAPSAASDDKARTGGAS